MSHDSKPPALDLDDVKNWRWIDSSAHWAPVPDMPRAEREALAYFMNRLALSGDELRLKNALFRKLAYRAAREMTEDQLAHRDAQLEAATA